jgi:hypothetical protein
MPPLMWTAPRWQGLFQAVAARIQIRLLFLSAAFLCLVKRAVSSSRPEIAQASHAVAVKQGRRPSPEAARSVLDRGEHDATLGQAGAISCSPIHCRDGSNFAFRMVTTFGLDLESAARRWQRSGQSRPLCLAYDAAIAAGHHGCTHACQAPICFSVLNARNRVRYCLNCLDHSLSHHAVKRCRPDQSGLRLPPTILRQAITPQLSPWSRHVPSRGRPHCASSTPTQYALSCLPTPR